MNYETIAVEVGDALKYDASVDQLNHHRLEVGGFGTRLKVG